ncbi:MAG: hypothetical protein A2V88_17275 [Elusimicrobia bacterium RBG_16_66_12]|nr:MAG: hypothetical protein A2V88_17275 [Elusimicrobia bacterium RBG_16_66_12]
MKTLLMTLLGAALAAAPLRAANLPAGAKPAAKPAKPAASADGFKNEEERTIYALGYMMGQNIQVFTLSPAELKALDGGVNAGAAGKPAAVSLDFYRPRIQELAKLRMAAAAAARKEAGKTFSDKFAKEAGVKPIPEGGWYKIVEEGKGALATAEETLKVHYRGTLIDGSEFDSSYKRGAPYPVSLKGGVIKCWINVLAILKVGTKAKIVCPSDVAYGDAGRSGIKGGETLVFDIEFVEIEKPAAPNAAK